MRFDHNICVDQRCSTQPATHQYIDVFVDVEIKEIGLFSKKPFIGRVELHGMACFLHRVGEFPGKIFLASLQHTNLASGSGKARGSDTATVAGANNDDIIVTLQCVQLSCDALHNLSLC